MRQIITNHLLKIPQQQFAVCNRRRRPAFAVERLKAAELNVFYNFPKQAVRVPTAQNKNFV
jgi:hypothetical protein